MLREERFTDWNEAFKAASKGLAARLWSTMPGIIQSVNLAAQTCVVQIAIMMQQRNPDGSTVWINISPCLDCPLVFPGGGNFVLTFPVAEGDECLLFFADRCVDTWWESGGYKNVQLEMRLHDLSDGFALVGPRSQPNKLSDVSSTSAQLRSIDGNTVIDVAEAHIRLSPDAFTTLIDITPGKIQLIAAEIISHATTKNVWDAGGTGFVYEAGAILEYVQGVPVSIFDPTPPEVPT